MNNLKDWLLEALVWLMYLYAMSQLAYCTISPWMKL
jgi:hypothetical protein